MRFMMGSVRPPQTMVVKITTYNVVDMYSFLFSPGMFCDCVTTIVKLLRNKIQLTLTRAKEIAPRSPANHITLCICRGMILVRNRLARKESGYMLNTRDTRQKTVHSTKKAGSKVRNRPMMKPIPIYLMQDFEKGMN